MRIIVYMAEDNSFKEIITEEELFEKCGKDKRMFDDFVRHIKTHPYAKPLDEYWIYDEN
jgi:hypothetical protein